MVKQFQSMEHTWDMICQTGVEIDTALIWCQSQETHPHNDLNNARMTKSDFQLMELPFWGV